MPGFSNIALLKTDTEIKETDFLSIFSLLRVCRKFSFFILVLAGFAFTAPFAVAQIKPRPRYRFEADFGYGFPEAIAIKFRYGNKIQAGMYQSFDSRGPGATGVEIYYHPGKKPRLLDQSPWYVSGGFAGYLIDVDYTKEYNFIIYPRAGRSFYFSRNGGISLDAGPGFPLGRNKSINNTIAPVLFTGSLTIFIRF